MEDSITLSKKERKQIPILEQLKRGEITQGVAAKLLRMCTKQVGRKLKRYLKEGTAGLAHRNRGKSSNRKTPEKKRKKVIKLYKEKYFDFGPTFASEKLRENHDLEMHPETLRLLLIEEKLWRKKRKRSSHKSWRPPKEFYGELVQLDGSDHDWFEGRGPRCTLVGFIDDATNVVFLEFVTSESHKNLMGTTKNYCLQNGKPLAFYTDRGKVFKVNTNNPDGEFKTQYERALRELDIEITHAYSPEAKGRVERLFRTLQDRLVKEMRLRGISDIESANLYLQNEYIDKHNAKFARKPSKTANLHRKVSLKELNSAFCLKYVRKLKNDFTISYDNRLIQLKKEQRAVIRPKEEIQVWEDFDGKIRLFIRGIELFFKEINEREVIIKKKALKPAIQWYKSIKKSPWRRSNSMFYK